LAFFSTGLAVLVYSGLPSEHSARLDNVGENGQNLGGEELES
jgi:hypothetical protein